MGLPWSAHFYTTGLLTTHKTRVIIVARKQRGNPSGKEIQMFNLRFVRTVTEYERYDMLRHDDDSYSIFDLSEP